MRRWSVALLACAFLGATACGTILYPERRNQPAGRIDSDVIILDAIGLIFFFVPGVIAFAVDFATGAIYLPHGESSHVSEILGAAPVHEPKEFVEHFEPLSSWLSAQTDREVSLMDADIVWFEDSRCTSSVATCLTRWDALARSTDSRLAKSGHVSR